MADKARGVISRFDGEVHPPGSEKGVPEVITMRLALGNDLVDGVIEMPAGTGRFQARPADVDVDTMVKGLSILDGSSDGFSLILTDGRTETAKPTMAVPVPGDGKTEE